MATNPTETPKTTGRKKVRKMEMRKNATSTCAMCKTMDTLDMVQCDACDLWFHFACVAVDESIEDREWMCDDCTKAPAIDNKSVSSKSTSQHSVAGTTRSKRLRQKELQLRLLEEERTLAEQREKEAQVRQQARDAKYLKQRFELLMSNDSEEEEQDDKEESVSTIRKHCLNNWLEAQSNEAGKRHDSKAIDMPSNSQTATRPCKDNATMYVQQTKLQPVLNIVPFASAHVSASNFYPETKAFPIVPVTKDLGHHADLNQQSTSCAAVPDEIKPNNTWQDDLQSRSLTSVHIAARQAFSKELPTFSGRPEDWPIFISSFEGTTSACGFSNVENLIRLQRCLRGRALEDVRSRLLLPGNVPGIIETLKMRYGRPELIIKTLLQKVKDEPNPKSDKLESIVAFALAVENLCSTMEVCGMSSHLNNPILLQELIEKLPPQIKLNWATHSYSCVDADVNLSTFSKWLMQLANTVSSVTYTVPQMYTKAGKPLFGEKGHVGVHEENRNLREKPCCICSQSCNKVENCCKFNYFNLKERWDAVKQNKLCRLCLFSHLRSRCRLNSRCGINGCTYKHHPLLHNSEADNIVMEPCNTHDNSGQAVLFRILPVTVYGKKGPVNVFAFLDEGSSLSLMDESLAKELQLQGQPMPLCLKWTGDTHRMENLSQVVSLQVSKVCNNNKRFSMSNVRTVSSLKLPVQSICMKEMVSHYPYLKGIPISSYERASPRILIGLNNWRLGIQLNFKEGGKNEPIASKTRLGWTLFGPCRQQIKQITHTHVFHSLHHCECQQQSNTKLDDMMKEYFSLDSLGVAAISSESLMSPEDQRSYQMLVAETFRMGDRFETCLLWKFDEVELPDSLPMALRRFQCLQSRLDRDPYLKENLRKLIKDYETKNYIRKLTQAELEQSHPRTWYLTIFPVVNLNKPGKTRIVWDAAAKVKGISLNSVLMKGPDQLTSLLGVLHRFREKRIAVCGDICEMYHQVRIKKEDQHSQRFLWKQDDWKGNPDVYIMQVMTFGATCSPSCAQFVKNKNAHDFVDKYPRAVKCIVENHYVDDLLDSVDTEDEAIQLCKEVRWIHQRGGFDIGKWISNSSNVVSVLGGDLAKRKCSLNKGYNIEADKVLGMWWCTTADCFTYVVGRNDNNKEVLSGKMKPTKREVLRILMSIFDPLGLIAHILINLKILLQDLWKDQISWDDQINEEQFTRWCQWIRLLDRVKEIAIPRCYLTELKFDGDTTTELHIFVDASKSAFAAVAYFRCSLDKKVECRLVGAKTRVSPIKLVSIPRLELEAARLGVRFANSIVKGHSVVVSRIVFWTDSKTVLCWIRANHRNYRQFVTFRVAEILESSNVKDWRYVPTKMNVADEGTKWQRNPTFEATGRWFTGPNFLLLPEAEWPADTAGNTTTEEQIGSHLFVHAFKSEAIIDITRFSKWMRLLRSQVFVFRFIFNIRSSSKGLPRRSGFVTKEEYQEAKIYLYRQAQLDVYFKEILSLTEQKERTGKQPTLDRSSSIYKLLPYLDEKGVLRCYGRIDAAPEVDHDVKRPILLPRGHSICRLIIQSVHEQLHHQQNETVVNELRQRFWIPNMRAAVKATIKNCQHCKNHRALPQPPQMGGLPAARLATFCRPFSYTGVDYFGPMAVTFGRRTEKRWGVLFTCMTTRAIHIEIATSLSSDSCILAIKRFMARRGIPLQFHSDNGTNFHGAKNEIQQTMQQQSEIAEKFSSPATEWCFNPPSSPHMGGTWERMIQTVKKVLKEIMLTRNPSDELLHSMMLEVEKTINCHPLTYIPLEKETDEALTPNHFLLGTSDGHKPDVVQTTDTALLRKDWMKSQQYANLFWKRWLKEYLPTLTRRGKWWAPVKPIEIGDIVIIVDDSNPRNLWPKGKILDRTLGNDGQVRKVTVQTTSGIYVRPAVKIAVLDVQGGKPIPIVVPGGTVVDNDILRK